MLVERVNDQLKEKLHGSLEKSNKVKRDYAYVELTRFTKEWSVNI